MARIFLVDDVDLFLDLETSYLSSLGHEIMTATSGEEALERLDQVNPDILLIDYYMSGIGGAQVCRKLRSSTRWKDLPVVMVTAAGKAEDVASCLDAGCDDYITKPVNKQELREKVRRLLGEVQRRTADRVPTRLQVTLHTDDAIHAAETIDISRNGLYLRSRSELQPNTAVQLQLELGPGRNLPLLGKVKRVEDGSETGVGIYLIHPDAQGQREIDRLIQEGVTRLGQNAGSAEAHQRLLRLEKECAGLRAAQENSLRRISELEQENLEFANQLVQVEEINNNLTNLYIASSRLHSSLDREETLAIIKEVVINFVGAERFAIYIKEEETSRLMFETGEGCDEDNPPPDVTMGQGQLGEIAAAGENYFADLSVADSLTEDEPLVVIPLKIQTELIGLLTIYQLFIQKEQLASIDYQLFTMLGEHAATAIFSSTLYGRSERKRQTYQGFVDLLLK